MGRIWIVLAISTVTAACSTMGRREVVDAPIVAGLGRDADLRAAFAAMDSVRMTTLAPGATHWSGYDPAGPWTVHVVAIDATACRPVLEARKPAGRLSARATTSALSGEALATINADFFRLPGGTPVGAHVEGGSTLIGGTDRPVFGVSGSGEWHAGTARTRGFVRAGRDSAQVVQVNRPAEPFSAYRGTPAGVTLFTVRADTLPPDTAAHSLTLRLLSGSERGGLAVITRVHEVAGVTVVDSGAAVLLARGDARAWAQRRQVGDTVAWEVRTVILGDGGREHSVTEVVGGFPHLLHNGEDVLGTQTVLESFGMARHPRTAIGWNRATGMLYLVVVDGRQPPYSDGMTLPETTALFRRIGATDAINLDGGGSTALVVRGALVNRPSDAQGERPVGNAFSLVRCTSGG